MIATQRYMRGITLIELMVVVVIIGILAAVSYPSYSEFVARAKRNEAKAALLKAAVNQERFYLSANPPRYSTDLVPLGFTSSPFTTDTGAYVITVAAPAAAVNFTVTATFQLGGAESLKCNVFTIDGRGVKTSGPDADCWTRTR